MCSKHLQAQVYEHILQTMDGMVPHSISSATTILFLNIFEDVCSLVIVLCYIISQGHPLASPFQLLFNAIEGFLHALSTSIMQTPSIPPE